MIFLKYASKLIQAVMNYQINFFFICVLILALPIGISAQTYDDSEDLADAVNSSNGGVFIVSNGIYNDFEATFEVTATADNPVVIKAETIGGVTLTGESHFVIRKSAYVTVEGFVFDGQGEDTLVKLEGSNNVRISRNVFELETTESIKCWLIWLFDFAAGQRRLCSIPAVYAGVD